MHTHHPLFKGLPYNSLIIHLYSELKKLGQAAFFASPPSPHTPISPLGMLPRDGKPVRSLPPYKVKNNWDIKHALFGQNDYIGKLFII